MSLHPTIPATFQTEHTAFHPPRQPLRKCKSIPTACHPERSEGSSWTLARPIAREHPSESALRQPLNPPPAPSLLTLHSAFLILNSAFLPLPAPTHPPAPRPSPPRQRLNPN